MKSERDKYLLQYEYKKFIENTPQKYKLFWEIIFNGGLRISEGLSITVKDILFSENKILIKTLKRKKHPIIPLIMPSKLIAELKVYIFKNEITDKLWNFSRQFSWKLFKQICKKADLNPKYSPHAARHYHGILIADITGGDVVQIQHRLRHSSIASTQFYIHCSEAKQIELIQKIEAFHKNE